VTRALFLDLLPVAPRPQPDERLSGWLARIGAIYGMTDNEFVAACGVQGPRAIDLEWRLSGAQAALLARPAGLTAQAMQRMTFTEFRSEARTMIPRLPHRVCPVCAADRIETRRNVLPCTFRCLAHHRWLVDRAGHSLDSLIDAATRERLAMAAGEGALCLTAWAEGRDHGEPTASDLMRFLTTSFKAPSPPSLAEQPRLSLQERFDNQAFLSHRIRRQALLLVVPEYDRVAPVLTKPVQFGLAALADASLLQAYALTIGVGRLTLDAVRQVAKVLALSDPEGKWRLEMVLRDWPRPLRASIVVELKRIARQEPASESRERLSVGRITYRQSHRLRHKMQNTTPRQSHDCDSQRLPSL
jgi:hypothetical protein